MTSVTHRALPALTFFQRSPWSRRPLWFVLAALILLLDYLAGPVLLFPILFVFPVMLAAWNHARATAIAMAVALTTARFGITFFEHPGPSFGVQLVNDLVRCFVLIFLAILVSRVARQNAQLAQRVRHLEGLIPICAHCKSILDEEKHWTRLETYIVEHSQAEFTHGICPACAELHYGMTAPNEGAF